MPLFCKDSNGNISRVWSDDRKTNGTLTVVPERCWTTSYGEYDSESFMTDLISATGCYVNLDLNRVRLYHQQQMYSLQFIGCSTELDAVSHDINKLKEHASNNSNDVSLIWTKIDLNWEGREQEHDEDYYLISTVTFI